MSLFYRSITFPHVIRYLGPQSRAFFFVFLPFSFLAFSFQALVFSVAAFASGPELEQVLKQEQKLKQKPLHVEVAQAKTLLAKKITNDAAIEVKIFEDVIWRSGAMGCPKADGIYTQALIKGYRIILVAEDREYAFHGREKGAPFYCESPSATLK